MLWFHHLSIRVIIFNTRKKIFLRFFLSLKFQNECELIDDTQNNFFLPSGFWIIFS